MVEKTPKIIELEKKLGKNINVIVDDILSSMKLLELKAQEEEARMKNYIPPLYQFIIAAVILLLIFLRYGKVI